MTPEEVLDWFDDPDTPTPTAEEAVERFRAAGIRSELHVARLRKERPQRPVRPK